MIVADAITFFTPYYLRIINPEEIKRCPSKSIEFVISLLNFYCHIGKERTHLTLRDDISSIA